MSQCLKCYNKACSDHGKENRFMDGKKNICLSFKTEYLQKLAEDQQEIVEDLKNPGYGPPLPLF